ncbi:MAG: ABC transporter permease [Desulfatirhabdiaceae bacterium]
MTPVNEPVLIIEPGRTEKNYWADLWRYRELFIILAWRDISVRYKQTVIGVVWAILRPFLTMIVFTAFIDFGISFLILIGLMLFYQFSPGWHIFLLPVFILLALLASLGPGLWITAINVKYRDFRYVIPFIVQFGLYVSPVGFSSNVISNDWRLLYSINPMVGVIDGFRWCILGGESLLYWPGFVISLVIILLFLWLGITHFRKMEKTFADII